MPNSQLGSRKSTELNKRILIGCFEVPGWGGASSASYALFEAMRADGLNVHLINIIAEHDVGYFEFIFGERIGNPKGFLDVHNCFLKGPNYHHHPELTDLINGVAPDIVLAIGWIAALLMKRSAPKKNLLFMTTGCEQLKAFIEKKWASSFVSFYDYVRKSRNHLGTASPLEKEAVALSDFVITHSDMTLFLYQYFFRSQIGKICSEVIWLSDCIYNEAIKYAQLKKPFSERDIDVIFVASDWSRPEKNYPLVKKVVSRCRGINVHIVGETEEELSRATHHGLITRRKDMFKLLGNTKTLACPSLFDATPGVLFEAAAMGCNIVASRNCGNWRICNITLLVNPMTLENFADKISLSLTKKYDDNMGLFLKTDSYERLKETILDF